MKTIPLMTLAFGTLALAGCSSPQGGTVDTNEYNSGSYNSYNSNVPGRPDGIHTYPSETFPGQDYPLMPNGERW